MAGRFVRFNPQIELINGQTRGRPSGRTEVLFQTAFNDPNGLCPPVTTPAYAPPRTWAANLWKDMTMSRSILVAALLGVLLAAGVTVTIRNQPDRVSAQSTSVEVSAVDFAFAPTAITAAQGQTIRLTNNGNSPHNLVIEGVTDSTQMPLVFSGSSGDLIVPSDLAPGTYVFYCGVAGHRLFGMVGSLTVVAGDVVNPSSDPSTLPSPSFSGSSQPSTSVSASPSRRPIASDRPTRVPRPSRPPRQ